ncbi:hypothetical protein B0H14DRAFT_2606765 [Mycena olivaceomarginata]|nr:hypothetical protein B0H14DRAFT_2606765 [Mycena olivaceomarginata]
MVLTLDAWQLKLFVRILDGSDVFCCIATGGGKSALFAVPIIVLKEVARRPDLYPDLPVLELNKLNVPAFSYCHETVTKARIARARNPRLQDLEHTLCRSGAPGPAPLDKAFKLAKKEREEAESTLVRFGNTPSKISLLPFSIISSLLDNLLSLDSFAKLESLVEPWFFSRDYRVRLYAVVHNLSSSIFAQCEQARLDKNTKQRASHKGKRKATNWDGSEEEEDGDCDSEAR